MTTTLIRFLYRHLIDTRTAEPRSVFFFLVYYLGGLWVSFIVLSMLVLSLDATQLPWVRDTLFAWMGEGALGRLAAFFF